MTDSDVSERAHIVRTGADRLLTDAPELIRGKRIGILTNQTGRLRDGRHVIEAITESGIAHVKALFGPEHGIFGNTPDGTVVDHEDHPGLGMPIYSLYGKIHKPTREMLEGIDTLVCDIQDVGARFYTFISTIALAMEAAAEQRISFVILDRPNPIRGLHYDGAVRVPSLRSFVGWMPIPVMHGLTIGELATLWNNEGWLSNGVRVRLEVVPVAGWKRSMWFDESGLPWVAPSPNMQSLSTAIVYPGLCFVEGSSISEGRGTGSPFQLIGAPWTDPEKILHHLDAFEAPGIRFTPEEFRPRDIPGIARQPKFDGVPCRGVRITITDRDAVKPVRLGIAILAAFKRAHPQETILRNRRFDILTGNPSVRHQLDQNVSPESICDSWKQELEAFGKVREKYLVYD